MIQNGSMVNIICMFLNANWITCISISIDRFPFLPIPFGIEKTSFYELYMNADFNFGTKRYFGVPTFLHQGFCLPSLGQVFLL